MADYRLSRKASRDLEVIAEFTINRFGIEQARQYRDELKACFENLVENPTLGRRAEQLAKGLRRFEHGSHIVFYVPLDDGALVVRVLHHRMDARRHL
ncbi:MAG TPA: type II toxin-antitoxin system RelE/ParE family toxin [Wenzhouxiangellaceae bacterium]|nr:type II toxin-antitoxin system RelE/ParE family toxin [Wenzhouxiangellaceae bacterium]